MEIAIRLGIASTHQMMGEYPLAIKEFKRVFRTEPNNEPAKCGVGMCYYGWKGEQDSNYLYWERHIDGTSVIVMYGYKAPRMALFDTQ